MPRVEATPLEGSWACAEPIGQGGRLGRTIGSGLYCNHPARWTLRGMHFCTRHVKTNNGIIPAKKK